MILDNRYCKNIRRTQILWGAGGNVIVYLINKVNPTVKMELMNE